ncbi:hypothetical protein [Bradyrhizobium sp. SYSU BS000235]|uniref:hypothetical protein n=1 Tax=Bradyrhizobium sp. SYSU BS000235 TaxID=3411332 RepID=UPI003C78831D
MATDVVLPHTLRVLFKELINDELGYPGEAEGEKFLTVNKISETFDIGLGPLKRLSIEGYIQTIESPNDNGRRIVLMRLADVVPLVDQIKDVTSCVDAARQLHVPPRVMRDLSARGLVVALNTRVCEIAACGEAYSAESVRELRQRIQSRIQPAGGVSFFSLQVAAREFGEIEFPWAAMIAAILADDVEVLSTGNKSSNLKLSFGVREVEKFAVGVRNHMRLEERRVHSWISGATAAAILKIHVTLFYRFVAARPDLFANRRTGSNSYRRDEIVALADRYIFSGEIARRMGIAANGVKLFMRDHGVEPVLALRENTDFIYERAKVQVPQN